MENEPKVMTATEVLDCEIEMDKRIRDVFAPRVQKICEQMVNPAMIKLEEILKRHGPK